LPHCSAVVHHAGGGTSFAALAHGLPSVALPQSADNFTLARRLSQAGVSIELAPHEVSSDAVSSALAEIQSVHFGPRCPSPQSDRLSADLVADVWVPNIRSP